MRSPPPALLPVRRPPTRGPSGRWRAALLGALAFALAAMATAGVQARCADGDGDGPSAAPWPADLVRRADEALALRPDDAALRAEREGAGRAVQALRQREVRLPRSAFCDAEPDVPAEDLRRAARGDADAALAIAQRYRGRGAPTDQHRYEGWLQFAAALGQPRASYELARWYGLNGQPVYAAIHQARAVELGMVLPVALDHVRK